MKYVIVEQFKMQKFWVIDLVFAIQFFAFSQIPLGNRRFEVDKSLRIKRRGKNSVPKFFYSYAKNWKILEKSDNEICFCFSFKCLKYLLFVYVAWWGPYAYAYRKCLFKDKKVFLTKLKNLGIDIYGNVFSLIFGLIPPPLGFL